MAAIFAVGVLVGMVWWAIVVWLVRLVGTPLGVIRYYDNKDRRFGSARGYGWVRVRVGRAPAQMLAMTQPEYDKMLERARANAEDQVGVP